MSLAVVILNWNNGPDTIACVRTVEAWRDSAHSLVEGPVLTCPPWQTSARTLGGQCQGRVAEGLTLWVVDNASQDGSAEQIARECPNVNLIRSDFNRGFGGGCNLGIEAALAAGCEMVLLLNNDAILDAGSLERLRATLRADPGLGVVGPLLRDRERPQVLLSAGGRDIAHHLISHLTQPPDDRPVYPVDYVPGTVALIRAAALREVGLLDEAYFFGVEMVDWCERARQCGYLSAIDARALAFHSLARSFDLRERLHVYYVVRNRLLYIRRRHRCGWVHRLGLLGVWTLYSAGLMLGALLRGKRARAWTIGLALRHAFSGTVGGQNELVLSNPDGSTRSPPGPGQGR